jgi:NitT/TauT family transport system permease protein
MQPKRTRTYASFLPLFATTIGGILLWEVSIAGRPELGFLLGKPSEVALSAPTLILKQSSVEAFFWTCSAAYVGLLAGTLLGTSLALLSSLNRVVASVAHPYMKCAASLPLLALAPLFTFWCGIDWPAKVAISAFATMFLAFEQAMHGATEARSMLPYSLQSTDKLASISLVQLVLFPGAKHQIQRGIELNISVALTGVIMGEFIASEQGLGHLLLQSIGVYRLSEAWVVVILIVGVHRLLSLVLGCRWERALSKMILCRGRPSVEEPVPLGTYQ